MAKPTAVVVCPGRGTYNATELGYLARRHGDKAALILAMDARRPGHGQPTLTELDGAASFEPKVMTRGDNASPLIFACSLADFLSIDTDAVEVVAVTGNSMGWYTALTCAGALSAMDGLEVVNTMGRYMHEALIGGQVIYPLVDEDWREIAGRRETLLAMMADIHGAAGAELYVSIELGGMVVFAGNAAGLDALIARAPKGPGAFPMRLANHAAFHTPLQAPISDRARATLDVSFRSPALPLIDGRGAIWRPQATNLTALWDYTFGAQVVETYDFTAAIRVSVREFAPDMLIILGPGTTLGGAVAQALIATQWRGLEDKASFTAMQAASPFLVAMGRDDQRALVTASASAA